jgi:ABC-type siderophore export system fused ATPase/permease subunit
MSNFLTVGKVFVKNKNAFLRSFYKLFLQLLKDIGKTCKAVRAGI